MIGVDRRGHAAHGGQRPQTGIARLPGDPEALRNERAVDAGQRDDIAHRAECDEIEPLQQVGLEPLSVPAGLAQPTVNGDSEQEGDPDRGKRAVRARLVEPVRIDDRNGSRQQRLADVMIDDDHVEPGFLRGGEWLVRRRAAIDRDHDRSALVPQAQQRGRVRPIAFAETVGHIDRGAGADRREKAQQQRRRGRAVHIVVAEHDDLLAAADRANEARDSRGHVAQMRGVGELVTQARREKRRCLGKADAALSQQPPDDLG
jgi:hypothetical protein